MVRVFFNLLNDLLLSTCEVNRLFNSPMKDLLRMHLVLHTTEEFNSSVWGSLGLTPMMNCYDPHMHA